MPAPPTEIRIKRKATDDPVDLLHVQNEVNGIQQTRQYVFKRQRTSATPENHALMPAQAQISFLPPAVIPYTGNGNTPSLTHSQPTAEDRDTQTQSLRAEVGPGEGPEAHRELAPLVSSTGTPAAQDVAVASSKRSPESSASEPRRFHLSRICMQQRYVGHSSNRVRGLKDTPAVFIERRGPTKLPTKHSDTASGSLLHNPTTHQHENGETPPAVSKNTQQRSTAPLRNTRLASGKVMPWNADPSTLDAAMQAYTMREIGRNLAGPSQSEAPDSSTPFVRARNISSFKPRPQNSRYVERHTQRAIAAKQKQDQNHDETMADAIETDDESSYVMDTYIRIPVEMLEFGEQKNVGLLVLDSQPDIDDFYNDDSDDDSDIYDEEEDENAENHPSTDYPDEEIDSEDEYGRNPYKHYHNGHASDNDEFDSTHSDDEDSTPSWASRPWMRNSSYVEDNENDDD